jgi:zinc D-Ala-D-Ala carboxypeptidase
VTLARWDEYPNFSAAEFNCRHTGKNEMKHAFMERLQKLRVAYGKPMQITSGFRDRTHPIEAKKTTSGAHTTGMACDIAVQGADAYRLIQLAMLYGFTGIGIQQKGGGRFVHLDCCTLEQSFFRPTVWSYP